MRKVPVRLEFIFGSPLGPRHFLRRLVALLHHSTISSRMIERNGRRRESMPSGELLKLIGQERLAALEYQLRIHESRERIELKAETLTVTLTTPLLVQTVPTELLWLQSLEVPPGSFPLLPLPIHHRCSPECRLSGLTIESFHPLVALAVYAGRLQEVVCRVADPEASVAAEDVVARWTITARGPESIPVNSFLPLELWLAQPTGELPAIWYTPASGLLARREAVLDAGWWERFQRLCSTDAEWSRESGWTELEAHLATLLPGCSELPGWKFDQLAPRLMAESLHSGAGTGEGRPILTITPAPDRIRIGLATDLTARQRQRAILHALAHLALGHVRSGDSTTHEDTLVSVLSPVRHRDRLASRFVNDNWTPPGGWAIESLADCPADLKLKLGLWKILDERLGKIPHLHERAASYQAAAYQRQAAARLVAMLDKHHGAMLCDGVGLGKTYVATTVMIHYVNQWRDQSRQAMPGATAANPYRITVIVPNQVESAWKGAALPSVYAHGVNPQQVRIITHSRLSKFSNKNEAFPAHAGRHSDLEHLILSDLVIVDEAHAFRSGKAKKSNLLRNLLRLRHRLDAPRRVLLLTATPINNRLDDLRFQLSLIFSPFLAIGRSAESSRYHQEMADFARDVVSRVNGEKSLQPLEEALAERDAAPGGIQFRTDLDFDPPILDLNRYLNDEQKRLMELIQSIRQGIDQPAQRQLFDVATDRNRIAEDLLDQVVVQRSRAMCFELERHHGETLNLLFRSNRPTTLKLEYAESSPAFEAIITSLLQLFESAENGAERLTFSVYRWKTVKGVVTEAGGDDRKVTVIGLQRTQILKRLESSLASFLISLIRLIVVNANALWKLRSSAARLQQWEKADEFDRELEVIFQRIGDARLRPIVELISGCKIDDHPRNMLELMVNSEAQAGDVARVDDLERGDANDSKGGLNLRQFRRLWRLKEDIQSDFERLLEVAPTLIESVLGTESRLDWPRRFVATTKQADQIDWPRTAGWGLRLVRDEKILKLAKYLLKARQRGHKVVIFSQFAHTIEYLDSVFAATKAFGQSEWDEVLPALQLAAVGRQEVENLREAMQTLTANTSSREQVINRFAPYYRIGPELPDASHLPGSERAEIENRWQREWKHAITRPIDILLTTDILAEGVNLQDVAVLINFDIHWNPVKMIQRAGRIDRRLNPRIEANRHYPQLAALAARLDRPVPPYYWHEHPNESPQTINMILPERLERELQLRERISHRTLLIDLAFGLEQGTGAEAEWMDDYGFSGVSGLNSTVGDRTIEQLVSHHARLGRELAEAGVRTEWADQLQGWFRSDPEPLPEAIAASPGLIGNILIETPFGLSRRFLLGGDSPGADFMDSGAAAQPAGTVSGLRRLDNQQLLAALRSLGGTVTEEPSSLNRPSQTSPTWSASSQGRLRDLLKEPLPDVHRFEVEQGEISSAFLYQFPGEPPAAATGGTAASNAERIDR